MVRNISYLIGLSRLAICFVATFCACSAYTTVRLAEFIPSFSRDTSVAPRISSKRESPNKTRSKNVLNVLENILENVLKKMMVNRIV